MFCRVISRRVLPDLPPPSLKASPIPVLQQPPRRVNSPVKVTAEGQYATGAKRPRCSDENDLLLRLTFQTPSPSRTTARPLRGRAPATARTLSADTGTDEALPNPILPAPPSPPQTPSGSHGLETEQTVQASAVIIRTNMLLLTLQGLNHPLVFFFNDLGILYLKSILLFCLFIFFNCVPSVFLLTSC